MLPLLEDLQPRDLGCADSVELHLRTVGRAAPPDKPPENVVVVNPSPIAVSVSNAPAVQIDPSANVTRTAVPMPVLVTVGQHPVPSGTGCGPVFLTLPAGLPVALHRANVSFGFATPAQAPRADVRLSVKTGPIDSVEIVVAVPLGTPDAFTFANGAVALDGYVVKGNSLAAAAVGEAYALSFCLNRGTASDDAFAWVTLAGTRTP